MSRFISTELESDSEAESKSDVELMTKLESVSNSDSEWDILFSIMFTHTFLLTVNKSLYCW